MCVVRSVAILIKIFIGDYERKWNEVRNVMKMEKLDPHINARNGKIRERGELMNEKIEIINTNDEWRMSAWLSFLNRYGYGCLIF